MEDYLSRLPAARQQEIRELRAAVETRLQQPKKGFQRFRDPLAAIRTLLPARFTNFSGDKIVIGRAEELNAPQQQLLDDALRAFMPWRKGPFSLFGIEIDAEWQSFMKWNRLLPALPDLAGKVVADIGCNNGYYMFRMTPHQPRQVVGFDPVLQHYHCFLALNHLAGRPELAIEPLGVEHLPLYPGCFEVVFLMGVIYHRPSPIAMLREVRQAMQPGGVLILESQIIPGDDSVALFPAECYAKAPGVYFVPTLPCLINWLQRTGFSRIEVAAQSPTTSKEQRRSEWMTFESYADFIDPARPDRTVEGYPAPWRAIVKAENPA